VLVLNANTTLNEMRDLLLGCWLINFKKRYQ